MELSRDREDRAARKPLQDLLNGLPGGVGIFYAFFDGRISSVYLNDGYYTLVGAARSERMQYFGNFAINAIVPGDRELTRREIAAAIQKRGTVNVNVRITDGDGQPKWVNIRARVAAQTSTACILYALFSDVDQLKRTQLALEAGHHAMEIASRSGRVSLWLYDLDRREMRQEFQTHQPLGYPVVSANIPETMLESGDIHPDDEAAFAQMYRALQEGAESCECTVRIRSHLTGRYEWQHTVYTRLQDEPDLPRLAIGFATNVDLQQELAQRYEHEQNLRRELFKNAELYYQLDLTRRLLVEYRSEIPGAPSVALPAPLDETLRRAVLECIAPEDRAAVRAALFSDALLSAYQRGEPSVTRIYRRRVPEVGWRWIESTGTVVKNPGTGALEAFVYCRDIDTWKKDQLAISSIMDEEIETVAILNARSGFAHLVRIRRAGGGVGEHEPFRYDEHIRSLINTEVVVEDRAACEGFFPLKALASLLERSSGCRLTYRTWDPDTGRVQRKQARGFYLDETREEIILVRRDITDLYEEEQRQKRILENAAASAERANRAKGEFLSSISHDMRTPLNVILSLSGQEIAAEATSAQKEEYLRKIHTSGEYLLGIISDVLDMSKLENRRMTLRPAPYSREEFAATIRSIIGEQCREKGITFCFSPAEFSAPWMLVDKVRFNQLFINLLSNAVKFTPAGGRIACAVENLSRQGDRVRKRFTISDTGIGISPEFLPHVFESFSQENRPGTAGNQGTGLGLAIARQIVELMGGVIRVESELGKGTVFTVELELTVLPEQAPAEKKPLGSLAGMRVLVCEDHPMNAQIAVKLLARKGCVGEVAEDGLAGLEKFRASTPGYYDLILMDIRMPGLSGLEAARAIRALERPDAGTIPILAMTANAFDEDRQTSRAAGMNGLISKPIEPTAFYEAIAAHCPVR